MHQKKAQVGPTPLWGTSYASDDHGHAAICSDRQGSVNSCGLVDMGYKGMGEGH